MDQEWPQMGLDWCFPSFDFPNPMQGMPWSSFPLCPVLLNVNSAVNPKGLIPVWISWPHILFLPKDLVQETGQHWAA